MVKSFLNLETYGHSQELKRAFITKPTWNVENLNYSGAAYDHLGVLCLASLRPSHVIPCRPTDPVTIDREEITFCNAYDNAIYGGHFFSSWGHFLLETLSTSCTISDAPKDAPVLYMPFHQVLDSSWRQEYFLHVLPILQIAWQNREIILLSEPAEVGRLWVPPRMFSFGFGSSESIVNPAFAGIFERLIDAFGTYRTEATLLIRRPPGHRNAHPRESQIYDEIENVLHAKTFEPWKFSVEEQIYEISKAKCVIGFGGSHLHNSVFMRAHGTVVELNSPAYVHFNAAQHAMGNILGHKTINIETFGKNGEAYDEVTISNSIKLMV
jgi:hypothetical protein